MSTILDPAPGTKLSPDDLLHLCDEGQGFELVRGVLRERTKSLLAGLVAGTFLAEVQDHVDDRGWLVGSGVGFQCFPDALTVRRADAAYIRLGRLSREQVFSPDHCRVVPDLVVEVVSRHDLSNDVNAKLIDWQEAGVQLVWIVYPIHKTIHAYHADGSVKLFCISDTLIAEPVLPEFRVPAAELFRLPTA